MTGFYMMGTVIVKGLKRTIFITVLKVSLEFKNVSQTAINCQINNFVN